MRKNKKKIYVCFAAVIPFIGGGAKKVSAETVIDAEPAWPLCGRITENPPPGWTSGDHCPADRFGDPDHSDFPLNSTFGPRILPTAGYKLDFHQGIDISTPIGTPVFAIAKGVVQHAGPHASYEDPLIKIRHYDDGAWGSCSQSDGCAHSRYMHLSGWLVSEDQVVEKGELIGFTGASQSGYAHLHFEILQAPGWDVSSAWNRDAIHPLEALPYHRDIEDTYVVIDNVDTSDPLNPIIDLRAVQPVGAKTWDVARVEIDIFDNRTGLRIPQPGDTPNTDGYYVYPAEYNLVRMNQLYAHKDSTDDPWTSFDDCPHVDDHGNSYDPGVHLERTHPDDPLGQVGYFNGIVSDINRYVFTTEDYELRLVFEELVGTPLADDLCVKARAVNATGETAADATWNCDTV